MDNKNTNIHIIAECGTNHNGSLDLAKEMARIASDCGADSYKVQIINPWGLYLPGEYEYGGYDIKDVISLRHQTAFEDSQYSELAIYCNSINIPFTASVFDEASLNLVCELGVKYVKLASCDLNNYQFLDKVARTDKKVILSTGMSDIEEIEKAVEVITKHNTDLVLMHCVSSYPASLEETRLYFLESLKKFGFPLGFSDHTQGYEAALLALSIGATWFEKHYTYDRAARGLDHKYAVLPNGFKLYIEKLRSATKALEQHAVKVTAGEIFTRKRARRALYAARNIAAGEVISANDILVVRPEGPMGADQYDYVIGKKTKNTIKKHEPFTLEAIIDED